MMDQLAALFKRDITRVIQEVEAFPDDATLWKIAPGVTNSAGNLALHLEGNLREYIGNQLGGVDYARDRPLEFSAKDVAASEVARRLGEVRELVPPIIAGLANLQGDKQKFALHLYGHLSYHLGQIDYLRRLLTAGKAVDFAVD